MPTFQGAIIMPKNLFCEYLKELRPYKVFDKLEQS